MRSIRSETSDEPDQKREVAHLWVLLNACRLIPNARFVHLRGDDLEQVDGIVNPSSRETLDLRGSITILAGALRGQCGGTCGGEFALVPCSNGTRTRRLSFLRTSLWCGLLCTYGRRLLFCKQPCVLRFACQLCLAPLLLLLLAFGRSGAVGPLVSLGTFL